MSFVSSLFSCCFGASSENEKVDAEARHARIVSIYTSSSHSDLPVMQPPPSYAEIAHDRPVLVSDVKTAPVPIPDAESSAEPLQYPPEACRHSVSSRSSIVSIPSTRLSDLTSMYTGGTRRVQNRERDNASEMNASWRSSRWFGTDDSAPPSYYAGSTRTVSPLPTPPLVPTSPPPAMLHDQHPVMQDGWFEGLMFEAERDRIPHLNLSNCNTQR